MENRSFKRMALWLSVAAWILILTPEAQAQCSTVYSGLEGPLSIVQSNTGNLLASESGTAVPNTGRISIVSLDGTRRTLLSGLPSGINDVGSPSGPAGLFMRGRTLYVAIGVGDAVLVGPQLGTNVANPNPSSALFSSVLSMHFSSNLENSTTGFTLTPADLQALADGRTIILSNGSGGEMTIALLVNFPDYKPKPLPTLPSNVGASNPFALVAVGDRLYVTDGGQNSVWRVDLPGGSFDTLAQFANLPNPFFPALGPPTEEAVPAGIAYVGGKLLVTLFSGVPFAQGTSVVQQIDPLTGSHSALISGLTTAIGILPTKEGPPNAGFLVLQFATTGPFFGGPGVLLRFLSPDAPGTIVTNCLAAPTSMSFDSNAKLLYVTELGGRIVAIPVTP